MTWRFARSLANEGGDRNLISEMKPTSGDRILDVGCGTGQLGLAILRQAPEASFVGIDPDPRVLEIARRRLGRARLPVELVNGFLDDSIVAGQRPFTKVVSSLVLHQVPVTEKHRILWLMHKLLQPCGEVFIADYAEQPTKFMRLLFSITVQRLDGRTNTQPNACGILRELMGEVGFTQIRRTQVFSTATGAISIYRAKKQRIPA